MVCVVSRAHSVTPVSELVCAESAADGRQLLMEKLAVGVGRRIMRGARLNEL